VSGSGISWNIKVCTSLQTDNHANTPSLSSVFLQAVCPSCHPTNSVKALKAQIITLTMQAKVLPPKNSHELLGWNCDHISLALHSLQMLEKITQTI